MAPPMSESYASVDYTKQDIAPNTHIDLWSNTGKLNKYPSASILVLYSFHVFSYSDITSVDLVWCWCY